MLKKLKPNRSGVTLMRYALVKTSDSSINRFDSSVDPDVQTKAGFVWLPCPGVAPPSFDPALEIVEGPTYTVGVSDVTEVWTKRNLTAPEISARKDAAVNSLNGGIYTPLKSILLVVVNDARATRAKLNDLIDATGQSATVQKYPAGQTTQINMGQLTTAIKDLLS